MAMLRALWAYRGFILGSVRREFQSRYQNSLLGAAWTVLSPLAMIVVYTVIFAQVMRSRLPGVESTFGYSIYLCAGLLTWGLFAEITGRAQLVFLESATLLKKLSFPRMSLPVTVVANALVNFTIVFSLFAVFLVITGNFPGVVFIALVPVLAIMVAFAIGLGVTLGILNVFFRDVVQFFGIFVQFWFWLTPVVYSIGEVPAAVQKVFKLNPMMPLIQAYQTIFLQRQWPAWESLLPLLLLTVLVLVLGAMFFLRRVGELVDEL